MRILVVGYGQMGREVERVALERKHTISGRIDIGGCGDAKEVTPEFLANSDAVIEFALAGGIDERIKLYTEAQIPVVLATTGWKEKEAQFKKMAEHKESAILFGSNFSIGAHLFINMTEKLAKAINPFEQYDVMVTEYHHKIKKDSPSGTALTTAEAIIRNSDRKTTIMPEKLDRAIKEEELHVASIRGGYIPGTHTVTADSPFDTIELTHRARTRGGFALGSVLAAEWLDNTKTTGLIPIETFIQDIFKGD